MAAFENGTEPDPRPLGMLALVREKYRGTLIVAGGFDQDSAEYGGEGTGELLFQPDHFRSYELKKRLCRTP